MEIKIIAESEMKKDKKTVIPIIPVEVKPSIGEKCQIKEIPMELLPKDMVFCQEVDCQRIKRGMPNNCTICQNLNHDIFVKCESKYK